MAARNTVGVRNVTAVLDCGEFSGLALAALRDGATCIRFSGDTSAKIADIAGQYGATVIAERPEALDLAVIERKGWDMVRASREWLEKHRNVGLGRQWMIMVRYPVKRLEHEGNFSRG